MDFIYAAYGGSISTKNSRLSLGFNGERLNFLMDSYQLGNGRRTFNPWIMRFISPDTLSPFGVGGLNAYAYCEGDPVNYRDPTGSMKKTVNHPSAGVAKLQELKQARWRARFKQANKDQESAVYFLVDAYKQEAPIADRIFKYMQDGGEGGREFLNATSANPHLKWLTERISADVALGYVRSIQSQSVMSGNYLLDPRLTSKGKYELSNYEWDSYVVGDKKVSHASRFATLDKMRQYTDNLRRLSKQLRDLSVISPAY